MGSFESDLTRKEMEQAMQGKNNETFEKIEEEKEEEKNKKRAWEEKQKEGFWKPKEEPTASETVQDDERVKGSSKNNPPESEAA